MDGLKRLICKFCGHSKKLYEGFMGGRHCSRCHEYIPEVWDAPKVGDIVTIKLPERFKPYGDSNALG